MSIHELVLYPIKGAPSASKKAAGISDQDRSISSYAANFFKGLSTYFQKDPNAALERNVLKDVIVRATKAEDAPGSSENTPATPGNLLPSLLQAESFKATFTPSVAKDRSISNQLYRVKAEKIHEILSSGVTTIQTTSAYKKNGKIVALRVTDTEGVPTLGKIIEGDIKALETRTTLQKIWDCACRCVFGSDHAKKALALQYENRAKLKTLLKPKYEQVMNSLAVLVSEGINSKAIQEIKPAIQELLEEGSPFQKETREAISHLISEFGEDVMSIGLLLKLLSPSSTPLTSGRSTPPVTDSDSDNE